LRSFLEVARHRNFTRAAEVLGTVQPSVSRTVAELEELIGRPLFERRAKGLVLTASGETLLFFVESGLAQVQEGVEQASGRGKAQAISLGILPNVMREFMPNVILRFKRAYPHIVVRIVTGGGDDLLRLLRNGEVDMMIGRLMQSERIRGLSFEHLYYEPLIFAVRAGHPLAIRKQVSVADMDGYGLVLPLAGTVIREEINRFLAGQGQGAFTDVVETISFEFSRPYVLASDAIIALPRGAMREELSKGLMVELPIGGEELNGPVGMTYVPGRALTASARQLISALKAEMQDEGAIANPL
jgi:LysR family pca operon transcriptional activator